MPLAWSRRARWHSAACDGGRVRRPQAPSGPPPLGSVDRLVNVVLAEDRLVSFEAKAPQPDRNVHDERLQSGARVSSVGNARVSRVAQGCSEGFAKPAEVTRQKPAYYAFLRYVGGVKS
jgi:hypothetical protein